MSPLTGSLGTFDFSSSITSSTTVQDLIEVPSDNIVKIIMVKKISEDTPKRVVIASEIINDFTLTGGADVDNLATLSILNSIKNFNRNLEAAEEYSTMNKTVLAEPIANVRGWMQKTFNFPKSGDAQIGGKIFTRAHWKGSNTPGFKLTFQLWADSVDESQSMMEKCSFLVSSPYPDTVGGTTMTPPWYFDNRGNGNISVRVGRWFSADNLILRSASVTFSKQIVKTGYPVFATVAVDFISNYMLSDKEFSNWFTLNSKATDVKSVGLSQVINNTKSTFNY